MPGSHRVERAGRNGRRGAVAACALIVGAIVASVALLQDDASPKAAASNGVRDPGSPRAGSVGAAASSRLPANTADSLHPPSLQAPVELPRVSREPGRPVQVAVPRLGIASSLEPLGLAKDGSLKPPSTFARAGWFDKGVRPGAVGPAIIAGHVDSVSGPAIFFSLSKMHVGDDIDVTDSFRAVRHFTVIDIHRYHKAAFPTTTVYGPTPFPVLRLVTCTGAFDVRKRSYLDNLVVSAILARARAG